MLNLFQKPIEKLSLESWAKMLDDIAKVAILSLPVMLYGKDVVILKIFHLLVVLFVIYQTVP